MTNHGKAFTLLEVLLVMVVVAALITLFLPHYTQLKEKAIDAEAYHMLGIIARAEDAYYAQNQTYPGLSQSSDWEKVLLINNPNNNPRSYFEYYVLGGSTMFKAYARRIGTPGNIYAPSPYEIEFISKTRLFTKIRR